MQLKQIIFFGTCLQAMISCSPTISNFNSYVPHPLPKTTFMPTAEMLEGVSPKIVVFELEDGENIVAKQAELGKSITLKIENSLTKNSLAQLVDRKIAVKLQKEIALSEMNKTGIYQGPDIADYAISGSISNAGFAKKYSVGVPIYNKYGGFTPPQPQFHYSAEVMGNIKIYELPSMKVVGNLEMFGKKSRSENVKSDNSVSIGFVEFGGQKAEGLNRDDGLVRNAGAEAVNSIFIDLQNFFAKKGFILEKRVLKNKTIFKISLGSKDGIKMGDKFNVIGKYENENAITNKKEIESRIITAGKVSDKIYDKTAWVIIDDSDLVNSIRLGDAIQIKYERSFFNSTNSSSSNYSSNFNELMLTSASIALLVYQLK